MKIYAGNLQYSMTEDQLQRIFEEYGEVISVKIIIDKFSGRSKGFGFVEMPDDAEAKEAIENINGRDMDGRAIAVNESIEKPDDGSRRRGGGNNRRNNY